MSDITQNIYDPVDVDAELFAKDYDAQEAFYEKTYGLSDSLLGILFSSETPLVLQQIGIAFRLTPEQSAALSRAIRELLVSNVKLDDFVTKIMMDLQLDPVVATDLANSVAEHLLMEVVTELRQAPQAAPAVRPAPIPTRSQTPPRALPQTSPPSNQSFHEQNMSQKDIMEVGGNVLDLRNQ